MSLDRDMPRRRANTINATKYPIPYATGSQMTEFVPNPEYQTRNDHRGGFSAEHPMEIPQCL